ncbi:MAG: S1 RNA-binding domain-containing protein [FCB group bacterium]|jgi:small subunit ribosomal protein S1
MNFEEQAPKQTSENNSDEAKNNVELIQESESLTGQTVEEPVSEEKVKAETPIEVVPLVEATVNAPIEEIPVDNTPEVQEPVLEPADAKVEQQDDTVHQVEAVTSTEPPTEALVSAITEPAIIVAEKPIKNEEIQDKNKSTESKQLSPRQEHYEKIFKEIQQFKEEGKTFEVEVTSRIRGGLRVNYKDIPMFLPASHFQLKRTPTEQELQEAAGKKLEVLVHEVQEYDEGKKAVIVSRKKILLEEFWNKISIGDIVEGKVSSVAGFGIFVDIGGVEGLVHISRLSKIHVDDPSRLYKKGDILNVVIIEIDKEKNRIALSRKELEESPWKNSEQLFPMGTQHKGLVRRLTDFGAYIELKPGVDGLLRASELSWTKRIKQPSDILTVGQELPVEILSISEEKQTVSLSYKNTLPNPWQQMAERFPIGSEIQGTVMQVMPQGAIISISEDVDGFMPRSKMRGVLRGKKIPYQSGDKIDVVVADLNVEEESLILAPKASEETNLASESQSERSQPQHHNKENAKPKPTQNGSFSLGDLLSENDRDQLNSMSK